MLRQIVKKGEVLYFNSMEAGFLILYNLRASFSFLSHLVDLAQGLSQCTKSAVRRVHVSCRFNVRKEHCPELSSFEGKVTESPGVGITNPWLPRSCSFILIGLGGWFQEDALATHPSTRTRSGPHCGPPVLPCEHHGGITTEATESQA